MADTLLSDAYQSFSISGRHKFKYKRALELYFKPEIYDEMTIPYLLNKAHEAAFGEYKEAMHKEFINFMISYSIKMKLNYTQTILREQSFGFSYSDIIDIIKDAAPPSVKYEILADLLKEVKEPLDNENLAVNLKDVLSQALFEALYNDETESELPKLLKAGADLNHLHSGTTLLHQAVLRCNPTLVKQLLESGANPSLKNKEGETSIILAVRESSAEILNMLWEYKADTKIKTATELKENLKPKPGFFEQSNKEQNLIHDKHSKNKEIKKNRKSL